MDNPCRDCTKRKVTATYNCHDHCKEFKQWKAEKREENRRLSEQRALEKAIDYRSKYWR